MRCAALREEREFVISTKGGITGAHVTIHESPMLTFAVFCHGKWLQVFLVVVSRASIASLILRSEFN